jgi:hypothetical protein
MLENAVFADLSASIADTMLCRKPAATQETLENKAFSATRRW